MKGAGKRVVIIGCGKVGISLGVLLSRRGWKIEGVFDPVVKNAKQAARIIKHTQVFRSLGEMPAGVEVVLLAVPDDTIGQAAQQLAVQARLGPSTTVVHLSGVQGVTGMAALKKTGVELLALHPIQTFSTVAQAINKLPGSYFDATGNKKALSTARKIVRSLKGRLVVLKEQQRVASHIASVISCNYLSVLLTAMQTCYQKIKVPEKLAMKIQEPLIKTTLQNIIDKGTVASLTGPVARGDVATVEMHVKALNGPLKELLPLYCELGQQAIKLALKKGTLLPDKARKLRKLLQA